MTTITVNKKTKAGKTLLELARILAENSKGITIDENEESPYNPEFVKKIKEADKRGDYIEIDPKDVWGSLGLK